MNPKLIRMVWLAWLVAGLAGQAVDAQELRTLRPRITVISFDPVLMSQPGHPRLHEFMGWYDPYSQMAEYLDGMAEASHNLVLERMTQFLNMDFWPVKADGYQYTEAEYLAGNWHFPDGVDYRTIIRDYDLARKVDRGEIDEVKLYGAPYFGYWESTMAGKGGYWCNSPAQPKIACSKIFIIMGWNYERGVTLHATGHRAESIMTHVYDGWDVNGNRTIWDRFGWNIGQTTVSSTYGVGSAHYPCNGEADYDYGNPQYVTSYAPDWLNNFPNFTGETALINRDTWGSPWEFNYFKWWYQHMPHVAGRNQLDGYDRLNNWWEYIFNFNAYPESGGNHVPGGTPSPAEPFPAAPTALTADAGDDWAPVVNASGRVVWYGHDGNDYEIFSANADGSDLVQITHNAIDDEAPQINNAGQVVWQTFDGRDYEIFTAQADGTNITRITYNNANDWHPHINDAGRIVWDGWDGEDYEIFSADADGSDLVQITNNSHGGVGKPRDDVWPRINAGGRVVWFGYDGYDWEIYSAEADGSDLVQLSSNSYDDEYPQISAAGEVVWHAFLNSTNAEIYSNQATGGTPVRLTTDAREDWWPQLNDAGQVVWMRFDGNDWEIMQSTTSGGAATALTDNETHDQYPRIDAAGRVCWQGFDGSDWEIYWYDAGMLYRLTDNAYDDRWPQLGGTGYAAWHADATPTEAGAASDVFAVEYAGGLPPVALDAAVQTALDTPVDIELEGYGGQPLDFIVTQLPVHGTLRDLGTGSDITSAPYTLANHGRQVRYTPGPGFFGADVFRFKVNDGQDSNEATVSVVVGDSVLSFTTRTAPADSGYASALASDGVNLYYLRRDSGELFRSGDGGETWEPLASPSALGGWHGDWNSGMLAYDASGGRLLSRHRDAGDTNRLVVYEVASDTWSWTSVFTVADHAATVIDGYLYGIWHAGGSNFGGPLVRIDLSHLDALIDERTHIGPSLEGDDPHWLSRAAQLVALDGLLYGIKNDWVTAPAGTGDRLFRMNPTDFDASIWSGSGPEDYWAESAWTAHATAAEDLGPLPFEPGYGSALVALPPFWSWQVGAEGGLFIVAGRSPSDQEGWGPASDLYAIYDLAGGTFHTGSLPGPTGNGTSAVFHGGKVYIKRGGNPDAPYNDELWVVSVVSACAGQSVGDANCSGEVNAFDIDAFILGLTDYPAWEAQYGPPGAGCLGLCVLDCNRDGGINAFDIDAFIGILTGK